jgi:bifunctional non-homologous end joining protein LigD
MKRMNSVLHIEGRDVPVTNLAKVFYPSTGFTKGQVIDYYIRVSPVLLPHLYQRPLNLKRYPEGVTKFFFYEKQCPSHRPDWVNTTGVKRADGETIHYCTIDSLASLVWAANLADLELHTFLHQARRSPRPSFLVFDLDPGPPATIVECCETALKIKDILDALGLQSFAKTSGSKGLQLFAPLNGSVTYERTKAFARRIAEELERQDPGRVVARMSRQLRKGKVFVDWSQNDAKKTTATVYSLRAMSHPTVSTPLLWKEVEQAASTRLDLSFESHEVLKRITSHGDLFEQVLVLKQKLPLLRNLNAILKHR